MKPSTLLFAASFALWQNCGVQAARNTEVMNCSGQNNVCTNTQSQSTQNSISNNVNLAPPMPMRRTVGVADLFYDGSDGLFARATATMKPDAVLAARATPKPTAPAKAPKAGGADSAGGKGGPPPLTIEEIIGMIKNNQALPPSIQKAAYAVAKQQGLTPPPASSLKPTPANLANHPGEEALKKLNSKQIPPEIVAAAKAAWGKGATAASGKGGKSATGSASAKGSAKGAPTMGGKSTQKLKGRNALAEAYAEAEAEAYGWMYDNELFGRDMVDSSSIESVLLERDAEADPRLPRGFTGHYSKTSYGSPYDQQQQQQLTSREAEAYGSVNDNELFGRGVFDGSDIDYFSSGIKRREAGKYGYQTHSGGKSGHSSRYTTNPLYSNNFDGLKVKLDNYPRSDEYGYLFEREAQGSGGGTESITAQLNGPLSGQFQGSINLRDAEPLWDESFEIYAREAEAYPEPEPEPEPEAMLGFGYDGYSGYY